MNLNAAKNRQWIFLSRPTGTLSEEHFALRTGPLPDPPRAGQLLVRTRLLTLGAGSRAWMSSVPTYRPPLEPGQLMDGFALGEVIASGSADFAPGDLVEAATGWQDFAIVPAKSVARRAATHSPEILAGLLGGNGLTAYFGIFEVGRPRPGETVLVSAAAGAVGSVAGQLAKIAGCRVVGVAGGSDKCAWLERELGFDAAVDYKAENFPSRLRESCPDGVDVYFDNTGGPVLEAALENMNIAGRIVCCGSVAQYDAQSPVGGTRGVPFLLTTRRLRMEGFLVADYLHLRRNAERRLSQWLAQGRLKDACEIIEGLENAPRALIKMLSGGNRGRLLVRVS